MHDSTGVRASFQRLWKNTSLLPLGFAPLIHPMAAFVALEVGAEERLFRPAGARPFPAFPRLTLWAAFLCGSAAQTVDLLSAGVVEILDLTHWKVLRLPKSRFFRGGLRIRALQIRVGRFCLAVGVSRRSVG